MCPLIATARGRVARFRVTGWDCSPPEWIVTPPSRRRRREYWKILGHELWHQRAASTAAGEDRWGNPLAAVRRPRSGTSDWHGRRYRAGGGPPLSPFGPQSRLRNLQRVRSDSNSATIYWIPAPLRPGRRSKPGAPKTFTELLVLHAQGRAGTGRRGEVTGVIRDVIGLPDARLLLAIEKAIRRWRLKEGPRPLELPKTSRAGASRREASRPEPERRGAVTTRLGGGERGFFANAGTSAPVRLVQRVAAGLFNF